MATCLRISCVAGARVPQPLDVINCGCMLDPKFVGCQPMGDEHNLSIEKFATVIALPIALSGGSGHRMISRAHAFLGTWLATLNI